MQQQTTATTLEGQPAHPLIDLAEPQDSGTHTTDHNQAEEPVIDISHELRTSLAIITLLSGNLDILYERLSNAERRRMIRDIRKHTHRLNDLLEQVLQLCNDQNPLSI
jgi:K+-sensing histidine kinase KdpD